MSKQQNPPPKKALPKDKVVDNIALMEQQRNDRRIQMEERKIERAQKDELNKKMGKNIDIDFEIMIDQQRFKEKEFQPHTSSQNVKLSVCVRKRPIFKKEEQNGEIDSISCANPSIRVHAPKFKVDGITKYVENADFTFDHTFNETNSSDDVYQHSLKPTLEILLNGGLITCFAYGQTGSGKTFTMKGVQENFVFDMFGLIENKLRNKNLTCTVSFFEIYSGRCYDCLNDKALLTILEDKYNNVQVQGLVEKKASTAQEMVELINFGHSIRSTHQTASNDTSSRSHAICWVRIQDSNGKDIGKLALVDLAGSERAADCQSNNRQRRMEGAEINKSLLALKECIRAMDQGQQHIPFRACKLTLVLRDSFMNNKNSTKIIMITCICPGSSSTDHSVNTLRYADRLKENKPIITKQNSNPNIQYTPEIFQDHVIEEKRKELPVAVEKSEDIKKKDQPKQVQNEQKPQKIEAKKPGQFSKQPSPNRANWVDVVEPPQQPQQIIPQPQQQPQKENLQKPPAPVKVKKEQPKQEEEKIEHNVLDEDEEPILKQKNTNEAKEDVRCMKATMKIDKVSDEFFDFHDKVNKILVEQEEIFATHMAAIKEDAKLLTSESELIQNVQGVGFMDYDIDLYVKKLEYIIKKKLKMYNLLSKKLEVFKHNLKEEEEISSKVKDTFYF